jgi:geranylgeranyl pyrophosphate synthase
MKSKLSSAANITSRYLSMLDQNMETWQKVFPNKTGPHLDFYKDQKVDQKALDYSLNIVWDMLLRKGKKIRPVLMLLLADIYSIKQTVALPLSYFVETVHNGTLIIDDIEDNSHSRRGQPCSHLKFGVDNSINAGVLSFFLPAHNLGRLLKAEGLEQAAIDSVLRVYIEEMANIHLGLAWDIYWHNQSFMTDQLPSEADFLKMVESKTSVLLRVGFRTLAETAHLSPEQKSAVARLANLAGQSFQIQDDLINLRSQAYAQGRGVGTGEDITEGKITLMVIEHVRRTNDQWLLQLLGSKTSDQKMIDEAVRRLEDSGAMDYADSVQRKLMNQALEVLDRLDGDPIHKNEFKLILLDLLDRKV